MPTAVILILTIVQFVCAVFLIATVLLQSGKRAGMSGTIAGAADTFLSRSKAKTWDAKLAKLTALVAVIFIVITFVLSLFA